MNVREAAFLSLGKCTPGGKYSNLEVDSAIKKYGFKKIKYTKKEMQTILSSRFRYFCKDLEEKGIQINEKNVKIYISAEKATASGTLYLNQQIEEETETERITLERNEPDESVGTDH